MNDSFKFKDKSRIQNTEYVSQLEVQKMYACRYCSAFSVTGCWKN